MKNPREASTYGCKATSSYVPVRASRQGRARGDKSPPPWPGKPIDGEPYRLVEVTRRTASDGYYLAPERIIDLERVAPAEVAALCSRTDGMLRSASFAENIIAGGGAPIEPCVYVIQAGDMEISKIGITNTPARRVAELQGANWSELSLRALFWCVGGEAIAVEQAALKAADEMGVRLKGEWVALSVDEASELVAKAARYARARLVDGDTLIANWKARLDALAEAKRKALDAGIRM